MQRQVYEYISHQTNDPIVEWKTCRASGQEFAIFQSDMVFYDKISPTFGDKKYIIPTPTLCPEERQRRRLAWRNERKLYKRNSDISGKTIISNYSPEKPYQVYEIQERYNDKNQKDSGAEIDFSHTITEQIKDTMLRVPHISLMVKMNENCDYVNGCGNSKDCYLVFDTDFCENCYYSSVIKHSKYVVDCTHVYNSEIMYNCINCTESYHLFNCYECDTSKYLSNCSLCSGCENCYNCSNLINKSYCIDNKQYSKEDYEKILQTKNFSYEYPPFLQRAVYQVNSEQGYGNNLYGTKNCICSYNIGFSENLKYCDLVTDGHNCYDISSFGGTTERSIESASIGLDCSKIYFSDIVTAGSHDVFYSYAIINCQYMFGCSHMKDSQYCIFNKQYTREEYENLVPKIIEQMIQDKERGEFLSPQTSPFGYNETVAQEYFPFTKEEALAKGYKRSDYEAPAPQTSDPEVIICEVSGKPFRLVAPELAFYKKYNIPIPRKHPDIRHAERIAKKPPMNLGLRTCDKCNTEILSVYPGNSPEKIYCESCYNKEIY